MALVPSSYSAHTEWSQEGAVVERTWRTLLAVSALVMAVMPVGASQAVPVGDSGVGLVDPATGEWHLRGPDGFTTSFFFGSPGDFPMMGDWDCDTIDTPGLYRQTDGYVYLRNTNTQGIADTRFFFGNPGDIPIAGDFDGDGVDTVSIYRPSEGRVFIINELGSDDGGLGAADYDFYFGNPGDKPFVGDFDRDGVDTIGLYRESTGLVYFRNSNTQGIAEFEFYFGDPGDRLIAGDWNHDGNDTPGLYRSSDTRIYLRYTNTQGNADEAFDYGIPRMLPVAGNFGIDAIKVADRNWTVNTVEAPVEWGRFASLGFGADGRAVASHGSMQSRGNYELALTQCNDQTCANATTKIEPWRVSDHTSMSTGSDWLPVWSFHEPTGGLLVVGHCADAQCASVSYSIVEPPPSEEPGVTSDAGVLASTTIGSDGNPVILYMNLPTYLEGLRVATCVDAACTSSSRSTLADDTDFNRFDIEIGTDGLPVTSAFIWDQVGFHITAMHCSDPPCTNGLTTILQSWTANPNYQGRGYSSVAIGTDDLPIVAYNDLTIDNPDTPTEVHNESLKVVHCNDAACSSWTTAKIAKVRADNVSAGIGGDGLPFVAYRSGGALNVAHCNNVACTSSTITTVDPGPNVGDYASLATDPLGMPMIAYYDTSNHDLKIARLDS